MTKLVTRLITSYELCLDFQVDSNENILAYKISEIREKKKEQQQQQKNTNMKFGIYCKTPMNMI